MVHVPQLNILQWQQLSQHFRLLTSSSAFLALSNAEASSDRDTSQYTTGREYSM
jgi:hypothetical protein